MTDQRFSKEHHVRRSADFKLAFQRRCSASDDQLLIFGRANGLAHVRLGLSVSRKVGGAVTRNRWKRLIREAFRLRRTSLPPGVDLVVIPRPSAEPDLARLLHSLPRLAERIVRKLRRAGDLESV